MHKKHLEFVFNIFEYHPLGVLSSNEIVFFYGKNKTNKSIPSKVQLKNEFNFS